MLRKSLLLIASLVLSFAMAQYTVSPTTGNGPDEYDKGVDSAAVFQDVILRVPKATALHLDVTDLLFDMTPLDGAGWPTSNPDFAGEMVCVYGSSPFDTDGGIFNGQQQVLPLGTYYAVGPDGWPDIQVVNTGGLVTAYPPIQFDAAGELVEGSKDHFVCYRTFILQLFSNGQQWDLSVERVNKNFAGVPGALQHIYIQGNPCDTFGAATGFFELGGSAVDLVPSTLGTGPTGFRSAVNAERCGYKSWLDSVIVVAVKVNADYNGDNEAQLEYTLSTSAWW